MKLLLERIYNCKSYCIGHLYDVTNGKKNFICDTLEDTDRGLSDSMSADYIKKLKVYGKTAIPKGTYKVDMNTVSPKFRNRSWAKPYNGIVPRILDVKGFEGILIHPLNKASESYGCIGVGVNDVKGMVTNSVATYKKLMEILTKDDEITLIIE